MAKWMKCKKCDRKVFGRGPDMLKHLRRECKVKPSEITPHTNGKFDPIAFATQLRGVDVVKLQEELDAIEKRRLAIKDVLLAANAIAEF